MRLNVDQVSNVDQASLYDDRCAPATFHTGDTQGSWCHHQTHCPPIPALQASHQQRVPSSTSHPRDPLWWLDLPD